MLCSDVDSAVIPAPSALTLDLELWPRRFVAASAYHMDMPPSFDLACRLKLMDAHHKSDYSNGRCTQICIRK